MNKKRSSNSPRPLIVLPIGTCNALMRRQIKQAGYLLVELKNVGDVRIVPAMPDIRVDGIENIALQCIVDETILWGDIRNKFAKRVVEAAVRQCGVIIPGPQRKA